MNKRNQNRQGEQGNAIHRDNQGKDVQPATPAEFMAEERLRQRMAEYCRRVSMPLDLDQMPLQRHESESYLPGVF